MENNNCLICGEYQAIEHAMDINNPYRHQTCPRCLEFKIAKSAIELIESYRGDSAYIRILYWLVEKNKTHKTPKITADIIDSIATNKNFVDGIELKKYNKISFNDKAKLLLQEIINQYGLKQSFNYFEFESNINLITASLSVNAKEALLLLQYLVELSLIKKINNDKYTQSENYYAVTPQGYTYFEDIDTVCVICKNKIIYSNSSYAYRMSYLNINEVITRTGNTYSDYYHQICTSCGEFKISQNALNMLDGLYNTIHEQNTKEILNRTAPKYCGNVKISDNALDLFNHQYYNIHDQHIKKVSSWILAQNNAGEIPSITKNNLNDIISLSEPNIIDRATSILESASKTLPRLSSHFYGYKPHYYGLSYSTEKDEISYLLNLLIEKKFIAYGSEPTHTGNGYKNSNWFEILPQGHIFLEQRKAKFSSSKQAFVAMWFDPKLVSAYNDGIEAGILKAGYMSVRMDRTEHINSIDDEMIVQIKASKFVVADFTGHRGGVYFEAGFALGLNMPVIWCCRKDHVNDLHFDIRQFNCIDWETPEELARRLELRIEAVIGSGPNKLI